MHTSGLIPLPVGAYAKRIAVSQISSTGVEFGWPEPGAMLVTGVFSGYEFANGNAGGSSESWLPLSAGSVIPVDESFVLRSVSGASGVAWLGLVGKSECPDLAELALIARMIAGNSAPQDPKANPLPVGSALADADPNPTTSRLGSNNLGFNGTTWDRIRSMAANADANTAATLGALLVAAQGLVVNDRTGNIDRMRQPDSVQVKTSIAEATSIGTTGVKISLTVSANKNLRNVGALYSNVTGGAPNFQFQLVRGGTTIRVWTKAVVIGNSVVIDAGQYHFVAGDVLQWNVTAAAAANTSDFAIFGLEDRFTF